MTDWRGDPLSVVFDEPLSIYKGRLDHGVPYPRYFRKIWPVPGHGEPGGGQIKVYPDDSVTTACLCHEPAVDGDLILGLRATGVQNPPAGKGSPRKAGDGEWQNECPAGCGWHSGRTWESLADAWHERARDLHGHQCTPAPSAA